MAHKPKVTITKSKDKQFYFELIAGNGQTIMTSETYKTESGCERAANNAIELMNKAKLQ